MIEKDGIQRAFDVMRNVVREEEKGLRLLVTGRVGTGRTALVALLAHLFVMQGLEVLAVDADPERRLAASLGHPPGAGIVPPLLHGGAVEEDAGGTGTLLHLRPGLPDTPEHSAVRLGERLTLFEAGSTCPGGMIGEFVRRTQGVVLLDTLAGVEHLGRAVAEGFSRALVMADPSQSALSVALRAAVFARALGIGDIHLVVNRVCGETDLEEVGRAVGPCHLFTTITYLPYDEAVCRAGPAVTSLLGEETPFMAGVRGICRVLTIR
ncbi:carbon monoxide dehydrogenase [Methanofollis formosanus]|uniref:Carbon monoxide dehydrogenase n=1 Tax=Methanofollis formosanus TaxID=299308 RepID=A0A8G1A1U2_9EURY|nr:carbon monoxide dehydrogenase [Methanofollis formosanus]QYZ78834.1 carbon monoxide dehydrogenase [Methanofollis formosanus]